MGKCNKKKQSFNSCALCGRKLNRRYEDGVIGSTGRMVCKNCLDTAKAVIQVGVPSKQEEAKQKTNDILSPQHIVQELDKCIIGQTDAKRAVAIAFWKQQLRANGMKFVPRSTLLLYGPTGCGKTAIIREAARIVNLPFIHFDATSLSETGYRGRDAVEMVKELAEAFGENEKMPWGVIFLDEIDKLAAQGGESRAAYARGTQNSLLRLVEGADVQTASKRINTEELLFVFGGAFSRLDGCVAQKGKQMIGFGVEQSQNQRLEPPKTEDFVLYGMEPELMGRITQRVAVKNLSRDDLKCILLNAENSVLRKYQAFFKERGVQLEISPKRVEELVDQVEKRGNGARGLETAFENMIEPLLFRLAEWEEGTARWSVGESA